jgi:hypothetical protein
MDSSGYSEREIAVMANNKRPFRSGSDDSQDQKELQAISGSASVKGIGSQSDPSALSELIVKVGPSSLSQYYAEEMFDSLEFGISYRTGSTNPNLAFSQADLFAYFAILLRERIRQARKERTLFSPRDLDVKLPHFFYLMLANIGEVIDERRHLWIRVEYDYTDLQKMQGSIAKGTKSHPSLGDYKLYKGPESGSDAEKLFVYDMSKQLRLLEKYGLVNGSALPRDTTGTLEFMLFVWADGKLKHSDPDIEPALSVLASLLSFARDVSLLNPYIPYGGEAAYRALLKDVTVLRNVS